MRTKPGVPLADRAGPVTPDPAAAPAPDGVEPPPGTACWITCGDKRVPGIVLGWQQVDGQWHALVSAWIPRTALEPRDR
jgi:hypothetical protein